MKIRSMKVNHITNPIGYAMDKIHLSWKVDGVGLMQRSARVQVASDADFQDILYDSGSSAEIDGIGIAVDMNLQPRTRYYWKVIVESDNNKTVEETAFFETGKMEEAWEARWIKAPFHASPYLRREFMIEECKEATLYLACRGLVEIYINGERVGEDYLDPGYSAYDLWEQVHTYKVTQYLKPGKNVIGFMLGDGWYRGRLGYDGDYCNNYGCELMVIGELHFVDNHDKRNIIVTDEMFQCQNSPVVENNIYDGEVYDARKEILDWCTEDLLQKNWIPVMSCGSDTEKLRDRLRIPLKKREVFEPEILTSPIGETILDFGQNLAGWVEGSVELVADQELELHYGEILQNGCFYRENLRSAKARYVYISSGGKSYVRPHFTYFGFRYVKVVGLMDEKLLQQFRAYAIYSDMDETMEVETSSPLVNRLIQNVMWGQKGNFFDVPTDCPQRNERLGWTGDTQIFAATASYQMDTAAFYKKHLLDTRLEQLELDGGVPFIVPNLKTVKADSILRKHSACAWGDIATVLPWTMYVFYGDKVLLEEHYPMMKDWVYHIKKEEESTGTSRIWDSGFHFGDWLALDNYENPNSPFGATDNAYVASAWYAYSAHLTAKAASVLGKEDDEKFFTQLSQEVKQAMFKEYFAGDGRCRITTQTAKVLALQFELVPSEYRTAIAEELVVQLKKNKMKLETGFCGTPFLLPVLTQMGYNREAYDIFLNEEIPGWLYEVNMGATTIWERWDSVLPDYSMNPKGMNSLNHYAYGAVMEWFYAVVCGIRIDESKPAFREVLIKPQIDEQMEWVDCSFDSAGGRYRIKWKMEEGQVTYHIEIPFNRRARVVLGEEDKVLESGIYTFIHDLQ